MTALRTRGLGARSIVPIGGGSTVFTPGLLTDLTSSRTFDEWTVHLVDINGDAAESMGRLGRRIAADRGSGLRIEVHTDRRAALPRLAIERLMSNLRAFPPPLSLISAHLPVQYDRVRSGSLASEPSALALDHVRDVLCTSSTACTPELSRSLS